MQNSEFKLKDYVFTHLDQEIIVEELATVHYFEYDSDFSFPGEVHNFWELLYVDKGEVEVTAGEVTHILRKGQIIFHKPMEFHSLRALGVNAPNLVVVSFKCRSRAMRFFNGCVMQADNFERDMLGRIIDEANHTFAAEQLSDPDLRQLECKDELLFGALQMIKLCLEMMLIHLIRVYKESSSVLQKVSSSIQEVSIDDVFLKVIGYLEQNIHGRLTFNQVCRDNLCGRSYLQKVFHEKTGGGVMEHFGKMKLEEAKREIREGKRNFTEISCDLAYSSIHYFSRHFKKVTGMTPTEYASSVKNRSEKQLDRPVFFYD